MISNGVGIPEYFLSAIEEIHFLIVRGSLKDVMITDIISNYIDNDAIWEEITPSFLQFPLLPLPPPPQPLHPQLLPLLLLQALQ